jgi:DNA-binding CsgD family transcriptional regulator
MKIVPNPPNIAKYRLSTKEYAIVAFLALGLEMPEICSRMFICSKTFKNHMSRIYVKLGMHSNIPGRSARLRIIIMMLEDESLILVPEAHPEPFDERNKAIPYTQQPLFRQTTNTTPK